MKSINPKNEYIPLNLNISVRRDTLRLLLEMAHDMGISIDEVFSFLAEDSVIDLELIENLDEIRTLFLDHPFVDFTPEWNPPDVESVVSFLCDDFAFNRARVESALDLYLEAKPKARQFTLGDF